MLERALSSRTKNIKKQQPMLRLFVLCICWITYIVYRGCVIGKIKYDSQNKKMIVHPRNPYTQSIAFLLQLCFAGFDSFGIVYVLMATVPMIFYGNQKFSNYKLFGSLIISIAMVLYLLKTILIIAWLKSSEWNHYAVQLANEVMSLTNLMESSFGRLSWECSYFIFFFLVLFPMTVLESYNYFAMAMRLCAFSTILLQIIYNAYAVYQMLLLSWIQTLNSFLKNYHQPGRTSQRQKWKLFQLHRVYSRINHGHKNIDKLWIPVSRLLFSDIVILACFWSSIIQCVVYDHKRDVQSKWAYLMKKYFGISLVPLIRIAFVSICNDRLAQLQTIMRLNLLKIDLDKCNTCSIGKLSGLHSCLDLQLPGETLKNNIISANHVCGRHFFMDFIFCLMLNTLSFVQYFLNYEGHENYE
ncbi:hypothetical protein KR074_001700 [Drosophila pseudoananassae]|nr:hypothetical protein KR074_001700 [Drosophila pseudoananassae]